jgi:hypothetical protein
MLEHNKIKIVSSIFNRRRKVLNVLSRGVLYAIEFEWAFSDESVAQSQYFANVPGMKSDSKVYWATRNCHTRDTLKYVHQYVTACWLIESRNQYEKKHRLDDLTS